MDEQDRQGFLDPELAHARSRAVIGVVGLSGGGSHIVQHLAHNGFRHFVLYDLKVTERKHLRRMVGARRSDAGRGTPKTEVMRRLIQGLDSATSPRLINEPWQTRQDPLKTCDLIFGAVDTFRGRRELESFARRHRIPMIDVGISVTRQADGTHRVAGQVILSAPGCPCMWCMGFLKQADLDREGAEYGDAGPAPQVVNVNAILAGAATWMGIDLLTAKLGATGHSHFLSYDGNKNELKEHPYWQYVKQKTCPHFPAEHLGDPVPSQ